MENIFKELFLHTTSRGVPFDCGCKGRYFLQTDQTLLQLFYGKFLTKSLNRWFSAIRLLKIFKDAFKKCHLYVAKHKKWRFQELEQHYIKDGKFRARNARRAKKYAINYYGT